MAFSDPTTITIGGTAYVLNKTQSLTDGTLYRAADSTAIMVIKHELKARNRSYISLNFGKVAPNPLISAQNIVYDMTVGITVNRPKTGFTITEQKDVVTGFFTMLTASTNANLLKYLGFES